MLPSNRSQEIEQAKFICFILEKALEIQKEKQVDTIDNFSNKISKFDQFKCIFPWNQLNYLIIDKLKEINQLKTLTNQVSWIINQKQKKNNIFQVNTQNVLFLRDISEDILTLKDADEELVNIFKGLNRG